MDTNKVGFYLSAHMGLTFNAETLVQLFKMYKEYKNSIFLVYDISKSNFGLNPIHAYRLSEKAVDAMERNIFNPNDKLNLV